MRTQLPVIFEAVLEQEKNTERHSVNIMYQVACYNKERAASFRQGAVSKYNHGCYSMLVRKDEVTILSVISHLRTCLKRVGMHAK